MKIEPLTWIVLGLCLVMAFAVGLLWQRLRQRETLERDRLEQTRQQLLESLNTLFLCVLQEQVELSEAGLRIKVHLDHLFPLPEQRERWSVVYAFYDELKEFSTHEKRKELTTQERFNQDLKRLAVEERYREDFVKLVRQVYPLR